MTLSGSIGAFAGILPFSGFLPDWWAIWRGQARPNRATSWSWSVVGIEALFDRAAGADYLSYQFKFIHLLVQHRYYNYGR